MVKLNQSKRFKIKNPWPLLIKIKKCLVPMVKSIIFCGHNNLPLRGHRDDEHLQINSDITGDQGIFL